LVIDDPVLTDVSLICFTMSLPSKVCAEKTTIVFLLPWDDKLSSKETHPWNNKCEMYGQTTYYRSLSHCLWKFKRKLGHIYIKQSIRYVSGAICFL